MWMKRGAMSTAAAQNTIAKRYSILDQVGKGGMGEVYRAADRLTGQTVALKRLTMPGDQLDYATRTHHMSDEFDFRLGLAQEFRTLASLRHPNIISVLDYGFYEQRQPLLENDLPHLNR
jgi:serine/threonine protein kinase